MQLESFLTIIGQVEKDLREKNLIDTWENNFTVPVVCNNGVALISLVEGEYFINVIQGKPLMLNYNIKFDKKEIKSKKKKALSIVN